MFKIKPLIACIVLYVIAFTTTAFAQPTGEVMIQGFNWESSKYSWYDIVKLKAGDLKSSRIDAIWMPPPSDASSPQGYLPRDLYKLDTRFGNRGQLEGVIKELHSKNIKVLADIVINHRVGQTGWGDFVNPTWGCWATAKNDEWSGACGGDDSGNSYNAARDLDHNNPTVRNDLKAWLSWLKNEIGFDGWRYDYVHGFGANFVKEYNDATSPYFSIGELWNPDRQVINKWVNATQGASTAFDFALKGTLQDAVNGNLQWLNNNGQAPGLIGINPSKSVTFLDNHDTGSTQAHWPFPADKVMQGYAYILTHPGTPMVFWDHFYDWGLHEEIKTLIQVRKENGLQSTSSINIQRAENNLYAAIIDGKVAMKIGSGSWNPGSGWTIKASGTNYAVWSKASGPISTFTVYFKKPSDWANVVKLHYWNMQPLGSASTWPGIDMTNDGNGWYKYTFSNISSTSLLFHDNAGKKTPDLSRDKNGWYDNGVWYDTDPRTPSTGLTVHFKTTWATPKIHYWSVQPAGATANTTWPGVSMISEGNGWYYYTIPNAACANIVFNNNGSPQTADLSRCGEGWYDNGTWYGSASSRMINEISNTGDDRTLRLDQNFPNPFSDKTNITFTLPSSGKVCLKVDNLLGKEEAIITNRFFEKGTHQVEFEKGNLIPGVYVYQLNYGQKAVRRKFIVE